MQISKQVNIFVTCAYNIILNTRKHLQKDIVAPGHQSHQIKEINEYRYLHIIL